MADDSGRTLVAVRAFYHDGEHVEVGNRIAMSTGDARLAVAAGLAELAEDDLTQIT
jgi:hypothetical protein